MSDIIRLLPDSVANQIAAGEVIQRPSSAIKELVENAADAGATNIKVIVKDAGKTMIQVIDNGRGMSATDARMAFERHATSKIRQADDLFTLTTMGFRGEALPSICAISEVEVHTKEKGAAMGTHLIISGSRVELQEPCVCDEGTVITVKKLFFNVPARRKFLKSDSVELSNIVREFERMALVNNHLTLSLDTGAKRIDLRAGTFKQRIIELWKQSLDAQLLPVNVETSLIKIEGFVSRPEFARRRNQLQYLIANGRNMQHLYFRKAILSCYDSLIPADTQPCYFLKFTVDPQSVDVNRSPTKDDIKFEYENEIRPILTAAVKAALGKFSAVPSIDFTSDALEVIPPHEGEQPAEPTLNVAAGYNPFRTGGGGGSHASLDNWDALYDNFNSGAQDKEGYNPYKEFNDTDDEGNRRGDYIPPREGFMRFPEVAAADVEGDTDVNAMGGIWGGTPETSTQTPPSQPTAVAMSQTIDSVEKSGSLFEEENSPKSVTPLCIQYAQRYIVTPTRGGLMVIDQHRAHLKILFEKYRKRLEGETMVAQHILFPESVELDLSQQMALKEIEEELHLMGFNLEQERDGVWGITSVPSMIKNINAKDVVLRIIDSVTEDSANYGRDDIQDISIKSKAALVMARSEAVRRGEKLSVEEMEHLTGELFALPDPARTPDGNTVFCIIEESKIDRLFQ